MKFRTSILLLTMALPLGAAEEQPLATPKPTILKRMLKAVGISKPDKNMTATGFKGLEMGLRADPAQVKVGEVRQIKVTVTLINRGKKSAQLEFPTSQRIEVLVKSKEGKTIEQWSEDQAFTNEPTMVVINPDERLEYTVNVATRDMAAGQTYTIEAFLPNFDQLRKAITIAAVSDLPHATPAGTPQPGKAATPAPEKVDSGAGSKKHKP
jgi:hypothetical protein